MSSASQKFFLTTPIYYVNARPHIGHAYTTIVADVLARRHRLLGDDTFFLTGTDEHGQKIERSAAAAGIPPQQFADQVSQSFKDLWARMGITNDAYIRTTDAAHQRGVQKLFTDLHARGQIYLSSYTGQYSIGEEMFVEGPPGTIGPDGKPTETVTEENFFFRLSDYQLPLLNLIESDTLKITPESRKNEVLSFLRGDVNSITRECYPNPEITDVQISIDHYEAMVHQAVEHGRLARSANRNLYLPGALKDLSVSRSSFTWGIPVPEPAASEAKEKHVIYVWLDALANYMTALGYGADDAASQEMFAKFWPADLHLVGKEIIRFHCVYWPAFLLAANLPLPKAVTAHGWLLFDDSKMSKSKGNIVRTETILDAFGTLCPAPSVDESRKGTPSGVPQTAPLEYESVGALAPTPSTHDRDLFAADVLRYFLLREIPFGQDGSFSFDSLVTRYNADLANGYGNLVSRVLKLVQTNFPDGWVLPERPWLYSKTAEKTSSAEESTASTAVICDLSVDLIEILNEVWWPKHDFSGALSQIMGHVSRVDEYLSFHKPWALAKKDDPHSRRLLIEVLYTASEAIRTITIALHPILPYATTRVWAQLGLDPLLLTTDHSPLTTLTWGGLQPGTKLGPLSPIFPRADKKLIEIMTQMEQDKNTPIGHANAAHDATPEPKSEFPETSLASQSAPVAHHPAPAPIPAQAWDPAAPPRTSTLAEPNPGAQVGGSSAETTERPGTPSHTEASSGIFTAATPQISIDDFIKIDLRVAKIIVAERIPKADKLLRLEVDLGYETRQILSGIAEHYTPEELIGRRIVVIANLAPRKMRGLESHGMLLAASDGDHGKPILATFPEGAELPLGSRLK